MATNRALLKQALSQAGQIQRKAISGQGFDPRGGPAVAGLQIATAGIGAFAQNRAKKQLAELEEQEQQAFAQNFPQFAGLAGQLSPETRQAAMQAQLTGQIQQQFAKTKVAQPLSPEGKKASDIKAGFLPKGTDLDKPEDFEKKRATTFKETRDLRKEFTDNSGEFIKSRDSFNRVQASAEDPSAAGDLALIFNFMKVLDPGSTVREGEFATAQSSGSIPSRIAAQYNKVLEGERLSEKQREDFVGRSTKLFGKAKKTQERRIRQFTGIAERNKLPVQDVILDLIGESPENAEVIAEVAGQAQVPGQTPTPTQGKIKFLGFE